MVGDSTDAHSGPLLRLVILDACQNNPLKRSMQPTAATRILEASRVEGRGEGLDQVEEPPDAGVPCFLAAFRCVGTTRIPALVSCLSRRRASPGVFGYRVILAMAVLETPSSRK